MVQKAQKEMNQRGWRYLWNDSERGVKISLGSDEPLGGTYAMSLFIT